MGPDLFRRRIEDDRLIRGLGRFTGDIPIAGALQMVVVRSHFAHARVLSVDLAPALEMPGVVTAFSAHDLSSAASFLSDWLPADMQHVRRPVLARDEVNYLGEPIAVVIAESEYQAQDAAQAVGIDLDPLPSVATRQALTKDAPRVHAGFSNLAKEQRLGYGDTAAAFDGAAVIIRETFSAARICGAAMEARAALAVPEEAGLTVWSSTQTVFGLRAQLALSLEMREESIRVLAEDVGGGFGPKGTVHPEEVLVAIAALRCHRPVRWWATRSEDTLSTTQAHGVFLDVELAADPDGRLRGLRGTLDHDIGAYPAAGAGQPEVTVPHMISAYELPSLGITARLYFTNTVPTGFVRGGGRPLGNFTIERMMDRLAQRLHIDRTDIRKRNFIQPQQMPYQTGYAGVTYDSGDYPGLMAAALDAADLEQVRQQHADLPEKRIGIGVACCVESSGFGSYEPAKLRISSEGIAELSIGSTPQGQGHQTMAAEVLANRLGWPSSRIVVRAGDTAIVPWATLTAGSRSAIHVGNATSRAAIAMRELIVKRAAAVLEVAEDDLELVNGQVHVKGVPSRSLDATSIIGESPIEVLIVLENELPTAYSSGCHVAVIELDAATGFVKIVRYVIAHDAGRAVNEMMLRGQLHGGFVHGIGYALFEEAAYEMDGSFKSASFLDYTVASPPDVDIDLRLVSRPTATTVNPEGVKGVGESGTIPVPAAIASAVEDAMRTLNPKARVTSIPITPREVVIGLDIARHTNIGEASVHTKATSAKQAPPESTSVQARQRTGRAGR